MTFLRTRFIPRSKARPGQIIVTVLTGPEQGRREAYAYRDLDPAPDSGGPHAEAARRLAELLKIGNQVRETEFRNDGSTYSVERV